MEEQDVQKQEGAGQQADIAGADGVEQHEFNNLQDENSESVSKDIEFLLDIPVEISVHLGSTKMLIKELLQLGQGSVVELDKLAGEPMEIYANNRLIARGEVVVVNEKFGVRLTDIISPSERLTQLK